LPRRRTIGIFGGVTCHTVITQGLDFGNGIFGLNIRTSDGRNVAVIPVSKEVAYRPMNDVERKVLEMSLRPEFERGSVDDL
jgi:hypothetical protein